MAGRDQHSGEDAATVARLQPSARPPGSLSPLRAAPPVVRSVTQPRPLDGPRRTGDEGKPQQGEKRLVIGREITLSGEIASCDRLFVEGKVEANLSHCRELTVTQGGLFKGVATIDEAEIRGCFEGTLNVKKRLIVRPGGRVVGTVRYGVIEIERGGVIAGDVQMQSSAEDKNAS
ncbi:MAG TPA: polymer-forming cytoskeletal protein [Stellaceae bacterium]|nr:polymer-forming cytoskeletal protein [Stellaceae bacterium]